MPEKLARIRPELRLPVPLPVRFAGYASSCSVSQLKTECGLNYYNFTDFYFCVAEWGFPRRAGYNPYPIRI
jgi:hypothetical protein